MDTRPLRLRRRFMKPYVHSCEGDDISLTKLAIGYMERTLKLLSFTQRSIRAHPGLTLVATLCKCISLKCRCAIYLIISGGKSGRHNPLLVSFTGNNASCRIFVARNGVLPPLTTKRRNRESRKFLLFNYQKTTHGIFWVKIKELISLYLFPCHELSII